MKYLHKETGSIDTRDGWIESYSQEELDERGLTAEEAFDEDASRTLIGLDETNERVIFDNGGGITVQLLGWAHYYDCEAQAAEDVAEWIRNHDTSAWEGHDDNALAIDPDYDDIRNGGYRVWDISVSTFGHLQGWSNTDEFFHVLSQVLIEENLIHSQKIQFDTVNGVSVVDEFDDTTKIVSIRDVFDYLDDADDGIIYGCIVDDWTLAKIKKEYGIR